jgi:hypothetical protein
LVGGIESALNLFHHIEMILDVLQGAIVGKFLEKDFYFGLDGAHLDSPWRHRLPWRGVASPLPIQTVDGI